MLASVGDRIVTTAGVAGGTVREGIVVQLQHPDGTPPYVVEWSDTGEQTLVFPGADSYVEYSPGTAVHLPDVMTRVWRVQVGVVEDGACTTANAVLVGAGDRREAQGRARRNPHDEHVALIGDEIAVGRALRRLADQLLDGAEDDLARPDGPQDDIAHLTGAAAHPHR